jgi:hypothetical protein
MDGRVNAERQAVFLNEELARMIKADEGRTLNHL